MGSIAKSEVGRRIIKGLEEVANDPRMTPKQRRDAAAKLAEWTAARDA
jgi:hypothetical protein